MAPAGEYDFAAIVREAAARIQAEFGVRIASQAQIVLLDRLVEHERDVRMAIDREGLSPDDLVESAVAQFREAIPEMRKRELNEPMRSLSNFEIRPPDEYSALFTPQLIAADVRAGMTKKCHWVPWC